MKCIPKFLCCGYECRRRTIVSKLTPALVQLAVVLVVWYIFSSRSQNGAVSRIARDGGNLPLCSHGDYIQGKVLHIQDLLSDSGVKLVLSDSSESLLLRADVIVKDNVKGTSMMYPSGTPVTSADSDLNTETTDDSNEEKDEETDEESSESENKSEGVTENGVMQSSDDNTIETHPISSSYDAKPISSDNSYGNLGQSSDGGQMNRFGFSSLSNGGQANTMGISAMSNSDKDISSTEHSHSDLHRSGLSEERYGGSPKGLGTVQSSYNQESSGNSPDHSLSFMHNTENIPETSRSFDMVNSNNQERGSPFEHNDIQSRENTDDLAYNSREEDDSDDQQNNEEHSQDTEGYNQQRFTADSGSSMIGQDPQREQQFSVQGQQYPNSVSESNSGFSESTPLDSNDIDTDELMNSFLGEDDVDMAVDEHGPLYTDGFHQRVAWFRSEYFGKPVSPTENNIRPNYILDNPSICEGEREVDVLYLIHSQPGSDDKRTAIRDSFAKSEVFQPFRIVHVFIVGSTTSPNFQNTLKKESEQFGDIVQAEFMDKPENATRKGLVGMKWALKKCKNTKWVMKIDEGVFVDSDKLLRGLIPAAENVIGKRAILCSLTRDAPVPRSGPKAFSREFFPKTRTLRPHCKGYAVLMTRGVLRSLLVASKHAPRVPHEDVYLYGVLPFLAGHIEAYDVGNQFAFHDVGQEVVNCYEQKGDTCQLLVGKCGSGKFQSLADFVKQRMSAAHVGWEGERSLWDVETFRSKF